MKIAKKIRISTFTLGIFFLILPNAFGRTNKLSCITSTDTHLIDTSYVFTEDSKNFRLEVKYAPGATPIESDPTTTVRIRDLKNLPQRGEIFSKLPQQFVIEFPKSQCIFREDRGQINWHCFLKEKNKIGELNYQGLSFFVYSQKVESSYGISQWYNVGLEFQLSFSDAIGKSKYEELLKNADASERQTLVYRENHETALRGSIVTFENTENHSSCYIPDHKPPLS